MGNCSAKAVVASSPEQAAGQPADQLEQKSLDFYVSLDAVYLQLRPVPGVSSSPPVRLLDSVWLLGRAKQIEMATTDADRAELALPHRQLLEAQHPEAFLSAEEVERLEKNASTGALAAGGISHAWLTPNHPDPYGEQLVRMANLIKRAQEGQLARQQDDWSDEKGFLIHPYHRLPLKVGLFYE